MNKKVLTLAACLSLFGLAFTGCSKNANQSFSEGDQTSVLDNDERYSIYLKAKNSGYSGSYEEWLESIKGADGSSLLTGTSDPLKNEGNNGDTYLNIITWDVFVKTGNNWVKVGNILGQQGQKGDQGDPGISVVSIEKTSSNGLVDTYTITYSNGTTSTFTVTNGADGQQGIQGNPGSDGRTPEITISDDGYWIVDGVKTNSPARGEKGDQGLSAYEIYIKYHPDYEGTEEEWLEDLVNGNLREKYTVRFNSNGGTSIDSQKVSYGHLVTRPYDPERQGYIFNGWYLNGEPFPFNSYQVYSDLNLYARWKSSNLTITLDANGGSVAYNTKEITYGVSYVLPAPTRKNYTFEGWYLDNTELCPIDGIWTFSTENITLRARWSGTIINVSFENDSNVSVSLKSVSVSYGSYFSLPIPTILSGDEFIGWATLDGMMITDAQGDSIKKSSFTSNVVLKAVYYICVYTPNDLLRLCSYTSGDVELTRTYVLQNDLDFTGLMNSGIENFKGKLDGNGHKIIGLQNPLFKSIGSGSSQTENVSIENITFTNMSATCIIENAYGISTFDLRDIVVASFVKDSNDFANFYGLIKNLDYPKITNLYRCFINDEFTSINCGLIYKINRYGTININYCSVKSDTKKAAFIADDLFGNGLTTIEQGFPDDHDDTTYPQYNSSLNISFCSNYGETPCLAKAAAGSGKRLNWRYKTCDGDYYDGHESFVLQSNLFTKRTQISNVANYGNVDNLFINSFASASYQRVTPANKNKYPFWNSYERVIGESYFTASKIVNFGAGTNSQANVNYSNSFYYDGTGQIYKYITNSSWMTITSLSQVTTSFFEQTIGLDGELWDLSYIKVEDEYGRPTILY